MNQPIRRKNSPQNCVKSKNKKALLFGYWCNKQANVPSLLAILPLNFSIIKFSYRQQLKNTIRNTFLNNKISNFQLSYRFVCTLINRIEPTLLDFSLVMF